MHMSCLVHHLHGVWCQFVSGMGQWHTGLRTIKWVVSLRTCYRVCTIMIPGFQSHKPCRYILSSFDANLTKIVSFGLTVFLSWSIFTLLVASQVKYLKEFVCFLDWLSLAFSCLGLSFFLSPWLCFLDWLSLAFSCLSLGDSLSPSLCITSWFRLTLSIRFGQEDCDPQRL